MRVSNDWGEYNLWTLTFEFVCFTLQQKKYVNQHFEPTLSLLLKTSILSIRCEMVKPLLREQYEHPCMYLHMHNIIYTRHIHGFRRKSNVGTITHTNHITC